MDYRCPCCAKDLRSRKLVHAVISRWEIDCRHCNRKIRLNMHPLEEKIVVASFGSFLVLVLLAYSMKSEMLALLAVAAGMVGPTVLPVIERVWLKDWVRYVKADDAVTK